jgi:hypothetical protein
MGFLKHEVKYSQRLDGQQLPPRLNAKNQFPHQELSM